MLAISNLILSVTCMILSGALLSQLDLSSLNTEETENDQNDNEGGSTNA